MLVGHFPVGLGAKCLVAKRIDPPVSLGTLFLAALLADVLAFILVAAGIEHFRIANDVQRNRFIGENIVYSHSLMMDVLWGALLAGAYLLWRHHARAAGILFAAVVSHWVLDAVSHRPDMRIAPGIPGVFGLGLWNSIPAYVFRGGIALLTLAWLGNLSTPPSQGGSAVASALPSLIFFDCAIGWAYWMDRARCGFPR